ncbi:MAG: lantibiotic dehydratase, partial [Dactylosporangium sp.]|nr:lantibiotic dehydratase [Dactylosporangium sp.]NNJ60384.1 lantibiotic dehydratase [Dactylosporangium sp.]
TGAHHVRARADGVWLAGMVAQLEACRPLLRRLRVVANDLIEVRGVRLWVRWQPHAGDPARSAPVEVSLRHTPPVALVLRTADAPVAVADLLGKLAAEFPHASAEAVEAMVTELVTCGALITNLRPPSTTVDGLGHVLDALDEVNAADAAEVAAMVGELRVIHRQLAACPRPAVGGRAAVVTARMRTPDRTAVQPLAVDLRMDCSLVLPPPVAVEAATAAETLLRLSPAPAGTAAWREYHARFLDRFGGGALVPVSQLVDPVAGLGFPRHTAHPDRFGHVPQRSGRDERLLALAQQAALDGTQEVVLDDSAVDVLAGESCGELRPAPHLDVTVEVRAATTAALEAGYFTLAVTGVGRSALATSGRFLDLLPDADRRRMGSLPTRVDAALVAQISFPPHHPRVENVTRVPQVLPAVVSLAEHRDRAGDRIVLDDLAVTADSDRCYLVSLSRRRVVEPVLACAAAWHTMPALARLLVEIPSATSAPLTVFDWGTAACLPFRPRLRYRRSILAPACWRIPPGALPGQMAGWAAWTGAAQRLRERLCLPSWVSVGTADRRLRLCLDDPMGLTLLRTHLDGAGDAVTLTEAPDPAEYGWFDGRAHEVVIPLAATTPSLPAPAVLRREGPLPLVDAEHGHLPGSTMLSAKLYGPAETSDTVLTAHLPALLAAWDTPPVWWFVRYHDPAPHLRLRIRTDGYGRDAERVGAWASGLRRAGLVGELTLDTYRPEIARYGGGAARVAVEELFAADSAAAVAQLTATTTGQVHPDALTAASLIDLLAGLLGDQATAVRWLLEHPDIAGRAGASDRAVLRQTLDLAASGTDGRDTASRPGGALLTPSWQARRQAANAYAGTLPEGGPRPAAVAVSLLHLHHNRAHSADAATEARTYKLARAVALAHNARHHTAKAPRT